MKHAMIKGEVAVELKHGFESRWDHQAKLARAARYSSGASPISLLALPALPSTAPLVFSCPCGLQNPTCDDGGKLFEQQRR